MGGILVCTNKGAGPWSRPPTLLTCLPRLPCLSRRSGRMAAKADLTDDALITVLRSQLHEQRDGFWNRREPLNGTVRHVGSCLSTSRHGLRIRAFRHEIQNDLVVTAG